MSRISLRILVAPAYLLACLLLGGSAQMIWLNLILQLVAVVLIAWAVIDLGGCARLSKEARQLLILAGLAVTLVLVQLVPLPPLLWSALPGRGSTLLGLRQLGLSPEWQPLSLAPYETITTGLALLPPLGMLAAIVLLRAYSRTGLAVAILLAAVLGMGLGVLQVGDHSGLDRFYLQPEHNGGTSSGFFANPNHMATLMLVCVPYLAALLRSQVNGSSRHSRRGLGVTVAVVAGCLLALFGLVLNRSGAGLMLALPVLLLSLMIVVKLPRWARVTALSLAALVIAGFVAVLALPIERTPLHGKAIGSVVTRQAFLATGLKTAGDYFPVGAGLGTFERVYRIHEPSEAVDPETFVNHAHDDYLEMLIETGLPGLLVVGLFLVWFGSNCHRVASKISPDPFALAGAIAAGTILTHSIVDYPLRTAGIAGCFAASLSLLVMSAWAKETQREFRPTRHVEIG